MSKRKRKKGIAIVCFVILILAILLYMFFILKDDKRKVIDEIDGFKYTLDDRDTELMISTYKLLKEELANDIVDNEKYAEYLSKLFIIDLYTMTNKQNKYDVGGIEYIHPDHRDNYKLKVQDTLYKYLEDESNKNREELPEVKSIEFIDISQSTYTFNEQEFDAYVVELKWTYIKDYGYDKIGTVTVIKIDEKLYVAEFIPNEVSQ